MRQRGGGAPSEPAVPTGAWWRGAAAFVGLAVAWTWVLLGWLIASGREPFADTVSTALWVAAGYGPPIAAVTVVWMTCRRTGVRRLVTDLARWRVGAWYAVLVLPLPVVVLAVLATAVAGQAPVDAAGWSHWALLPAMFLGGILLGGLEEIGWRGYLLPRLQDRLAALTASVFIGLVWALWHAPLFLLDSTTQAGSSALWFTVQAVALSVILTWIYNSTRGSLLLAVLFHGALNGWYTAVVQGIAPEALDSFTAPAALLTVLVATWIVVRHGPADLSARSRIAWRGARLDDAGRSTRVDREVVTVPH